MTKSLKTYIGGKASVATVCPAMTAAVQRQVYNP